jgi:cobalt-zinc-cadmium efflux system protein
VALTAHLVKPDSTDNDKLLEKAGRELRDRFGIKHTTIQWERRYESDRCGDSCEIGEIGAASRKEH